MDGVVKLKPLPINVPPVDALYQSIVPVGLLADIVTVPGPHLDALTGPVAAAGAVFIVAVTSVLGVETQPIVVFLATT